jgi:hypothetical protein
MNFEKCGFCHRRIAKTARLDAVYCSPGCRMSALRVRKREQRMAERAAARAKEGRGTEGQVRLAALKAAYQVRVQGARLAVGLPNLPEDPWLTAQAEIAACDKMIDHLQEHKKALQAQAAKLPAPSEAYRSRPLESKGKDPPGLSAKVLRFGVGMLHGELEGEAILFISEEVDKGQGGRTFYSPKHPPRSGG